MIKMITKEMLKKIAPYSKDVIISALVEPLNEHLPKYGVDTHLRVTHFLAQAAHETAGFKTLEEYASGQAYEGRKDLGNTKPGDGKKYKGRGIFQLTGRANYKTFGKKIGKDLEGNPILAGDAETSVLIALEYWNNRKLSPLADKDDVTAITKKINGGLNGFEDRKKYLAKAKKIVPQDISFVKEEKEEVLPPLVAIENALTDVTEKIKIVVEDKKNEVESVTQGTSLVSLFIMFLKAIFSKKER
jgi:putative chitinase